MYITIIASGSTGNCSVISDGETHLLLDAGISFKRIREGLQGAGLTPDDLSGVLVTHEHSDHVSGLPVMLRHCRLPVFATMPVIRALDPGLEPEKFVGIETWNPFEIGGIRITAFHTPHDSADCVGYRFEHQSLIAYATDCGCITDEVIEGLSGADVALIEANHDIEMLQKGPYPPYLKKRILSNKGHLSNGSCADLARHLQKEGTGEIVLGHLSRHNNTPACARECVGRCLDETRTALHVAPQLGLMTVRTDH